MINRLSSVKEGLQSNCNKVYSRSSFNTMWILKYSYDLLDNFNSRFNTREVHVSKNDLNRLHTIPLENASTRLKK